MSRKGTPKYQINVHRSGRFIWYAIIIIIIIKRRIAEKRNRSGSGSCMQPLPCACVVQGFGSPAADLKKNTKQKREKENDNSQQTKNQPKQSRE